MYHFSYVVFLSYVSNLDWMSADNSLITLQSEQTQFKKLFG